MLLPPYNFNSIEVYPPTNVRKNFVPTKFWQIFELIPRIIMGGGTGRYHAAFFILQCTSLIIHNWISKYKKDPLSWFRY